MGSMEKPPHAVCVPFPAQGHINPMLKLAKLLHFKGFHITFVNTEFNHKRLLKSRGHKSLDGLPSFRFDTIPDGLPPTGDVDATQDIASLFDSTTKNCLVPFRELVLRLNDLSASSSKDSNNPPVSCIVSDVGMFFTLDVAEELGIPDVLLCTCSACSFMAYLHFPQLIQKDLVPLKDASYLTNGYLDTPIDWIPGMKNVRLRDIPSFIRTTDPEDILLNFGAVFPARAKKASAIVFHTFEPIEHEILQAFPKLIPPPVYSIGPLELLLLNHVPDNDLTSIGSNLWKEEAECLKWLDSKSPNSVVYVNFGSITVMASHQLIEFAWGLADAKQNFLWVIRPDIVCGDSEILPPEFITETKNRGLLSSWCPQKQVLEHLSIGGFLTHCGWNSTLESVCGGVPMICWPFFADQQTNCRYCCTEWGIGTEINSDVKRDEVERVVRELMEGEKGKQRKKRALEWKNLAEEATAVPNGSSYVNLEKVINEVLLQPLSRMNTAQ